MLTATSLKHPSIKAKIMKATSNAIRWAKDYKGASSTSVAMLTIGKHTLFIKANNKGKVISVDCYNDKTQKFLGDIKETIAASF